MSELFENVNGQLVPRDICARKHGGNGQSKSAFDSISDHLNEAQRRVFNEILYHPNDGITTDQLAIDLCTTPNAISGRVTELKIKGRIRSSGRRKTRSGCYASIWFPV